LTIESLELVQEVGTGNGEWHRWLGFRTIWVCL